MYQENESQFIAALASDLRKVRRVDRLEVYILLTLYCILIRRPCCSILE